MSLLAKVDLPPDVFAVVMATGIVAIAARDHAYRWIDLALVVIATTTFVLLGVGLAVKVITEPGSAVGQVTDPDVALRLFTSVAACAVLAARFAAHPTVVWGCGAAGAAAWLVLTPLAVSDVRSRPRTDLRDHAHGAWLLPSVATAGLAITSADLSTITGAAGLVISAAVLWVLALLVYLAVTSLIAWRAVAAPFVPEEVTPDAWILMGALAISTLAGGRVLAAAAQMGSLGRLEAVARPLTLLLWVSASLWIPFLAYAEVWSVERTVGSLRFAGVWWSGVFPLGMYSVATETTAQAFHLQRLQTVSLVFFWIAVGAWLLVAAGWVHSRLRRGPHAQARATPR